MFVKDRSGRTRAVDAGYVLKDGESISVGMTTFDAAPLAPPVAIVTGDAARGEEFTKGAAFASQVIYERRISDAWRDSDTTPVALDRGEMNGADAALASQEAYERRVSDAWRDTTPEAGR